MSAASNYLEKKLLDHVLNYGTLPYTGEATVYLALFDNDGAVTATNLEAGTLTDEVANLYAYARQAVTFAAAHATDGTATTSATVTFPTANGGNWGTITHVAIMDSATHGAGNVLFWGAVTTPKLIEDGDTFQVTAGNLTVTLA